MSSGQFWAMIIGACVVLIGAAIVAGVAIRARKGTRQRWLLSWASLGLALLAAVTVAAARQPAKAQTDSPQFTALVTALREHGFFTNYTHQKDVDYYNNGQAGSVLVVLIPMTGKEHTLTVVDFTVDGAGAYHFGCFGGSHHKLWDFQLYPDVAWRWATAQGCAPDLPDPPV